MVLGVQTIPLVLPRADGSFEIVADNGFSRELGLYFRIDPALKAALPDPSRITLEDGKQAYALLADDWLCDVDTDANGKAVTVGIGLSIIERQLLPMRPGFFVTAASARSGKTTLLGMVSAAVLGRYAAATGWSLREEEREKALFSYFTAGVALLIWDNIARGTSISSAAVDRSLTSLDYQMRILGVLKRGMANSATIQSWTGNAIAPYGDMASRCFTVMLRSSRVDPENRKFKHPNPIGWSLANRVRILSAMYTILCLPRPVVDQGDTRFKEWWRLVGRPIEMVSGRQLQRHDKRDPGARQRKQRAQFCAYGVARQVRVQAVHGARCRGAAVSLHIRAVRRRRTERSGASPCRRTATGVGKLGRETFPAWRSPARQAVGKKLGMLLNRPGLVQGDTVKLVEAEPRHDGKTYVAEFIMAAEKPRADPPTNAPEGAGQANASVHAAAAASTGGAFPHEDEPV